MSEDYKHGFASLVNVEAYPENLPKWRRDPGLLDRIVQETEEIGRIDLASEMCNTRYEVVKKWMQQGNIEATSSEQRNEDEYTTLGQFYIDMIRAKAKFYGDRIKEMKELVMGENGFKFEKYLPWLLENVDEEKRFSPRMFNNQKTEETITKTIKVIYADGAQWVAGGQKYLAIEDGNTIDTELKELPPGPEVEDF